MVTRSSDRTGILIVRLWIEEGTSEGFRARITETLDSRGRDLTGSAVANPEGVYATVRTWVEGFLEADGALDPSGLPSRDVSVTPPSDGVTDISDFRRK